MLNYRRAMFASIPVVLTLAAGVARADATADLIALDKQWGAAGGKGDTAAMAKLLADNLVSVDQDGIRGKKDELALAKPDPDAGTYEPTDYKVTFMGDDMAIMTHATKGKDAHNSLHVWSKKGGHWQVVASSSTPIKAK